MKTDPFLRAAGVAVFSALFTGATVVSAQQQQSPQSDIGALLQGILQGANQQTENPPELAGFRDLKAQLPAELPGMKRISASGEKTGAFGMSMAFAEAAYRAEDGGTITIKITDSGGMPGIAAMAQAGFAASEIDRETETGYQRTTTLKGYRAMEEFDSRYQTGSIMIMAEKRLTFEVKGRKTSMEKIKGAVDALDFEAIVGLVKKAGENTEEAGEEKSP